MNGFCLGLMLILVGVILDMAITVPFFVKDYSFFFHIDIIIGMIIVIVISSLVGMASR